MTAVISFAKTKLSHIRHPYLSSKITKFQKAINYKEQHNQNLPFVFLKSIVIVFQLYTMSNAFRNLIIPSC